MVFAKKERPVEGTSFPISLVINFPSCSSTKCNHERWRQEGQWDCAPNYTCNLVSYIDVPFESSPPASRHLYRCNQLTEAAIQWLDFRSVSMQQMTAANTIIGTLLLWRQQLSYVSQKGASAWLSKSCRKHVSAGCCSWHNLHVAHWNSPPVIAGMTSVRLSRMYVHHQAKLAFSETSFASKSANCVPKCLIHFGFEVLPQSMFAMSVDKHHGEVWSIFLEDMGR